MNHRILYAAVTVVVTLCACQLQPARTDPVVEGRRLVVVDRIGVDYGESSEVFGNISGAVFINDSVFVVLDKGYQELRVFDVNCDHIATQSYQGNGPLEYRCAEYLVVAGSNFAVLEFNMPPRCVFFDQQAAPVSSVTFEGMTALQEPAFVKDSIVTGFMGTIHREGSSVSIGYEVCVWNTVSGERKRVLYSRFLEIDALEDSYSLLVQLENSVAASSSGIVFVAPDRDGYEILVFSLDGTLLDTICTPHDRVLREASEIEQEQVWRKFRDGGMDNWEPSVYEPGITDIQVQDSEGYVWVCHGSRFKPSFDVYTLDGELAFTCICQGLPGDEMIAFGISNHGILAYTICPYTFPKVFVMELE